jgi:Mrp family chromosome partitioning ATPase
LGRLGLVIADLDAEYIRNFEKYLVANYPGRFDLAAFSSVHALQDFLESKSHADIILVDSRMYDESKTCYDRGLVLLLTESRPGKQCPGKAAGQVMKYQHVDRLISEVLGLYSANTGSGRPVHGRRKTCIVSVASPAGGTGKSSIAAGCSILCAGRGLKTFFLCLESVPSTDRFFRGESDQSFSNVIFHLKGSGSLWLKLESARCHDPRTSVHFFKSPECILEMNEFDEKDAARLISEFRSCCAYDMVFVDLSSGLNSINAEVMRLSDVILLVLTRDAVVESKTGVFTKGLDLLDSRWKSALPERIIPLLNLSPAFDGDGPVCGYSPAAVIADHSNKSSNSPDDCVVNDVSFLADLNGVVEQILAGRSAAADSVEGGGSVA